MINPNLNLFSGFRHTLLSLLAVACTLPAFATQSDFKSLAGTWRFQLDRANTGFSEKWFEHRLSGEAKLPGSLPAQNIGDAVSLDTKWTGGIQNPQWFTNPIYAPYTKPDNFKFPFWLQPGKYYSGAAWYQRDIEIPADWQNQRVVLTLERPHWETRAWIDGKELGSNKSLSTPHEYDLGISLTPGKHQLTLRVDNGRIVDIGENSHAITDHTQGNWNGIVGRIGLRATPPVWIDDAQVFPNLDEKSVRLKVRLRNATGKPGQSVLTITGGPGVSPAKTFLVSWDAKGGSKEFQLPLGDNARPWDEFSPELQKVTLRLQVGSDSDQRTITFGLREIKVDGRQLVLNGRKIFIRGTLECCIFPLTGHPPTDVDSWKRIIRIAKSYGLNLIRFHSYCPPEAAFAAADELGFYYQVETCWANQSTTIGDGKPVDQWVYDETVRILKTYGNHPSFLLMPYGNEPGGKKATAYLAEYVIHFKALDSRRLWTSGSGWPQLAENEFHITPDPRVQGWGAGLKSRINARPPETQTDYRDYIQQRTVPVISHEIGQWCVYPNFDEIRKYKGYLKPKNFEIFRDTLNAHYLGGQAREFLLASGKLQTLCYKEDIESALRTPDMAGFELLDLHDFPGQGTALVGVLDPFWDDKGYVTAKEYSRFCNRTVPLARLAKRVFTTDEVLQASLEVAHFGPGPLPSPAVAWKLVDASGKSVGNGEWTLPSPVPVGNAFPLGNISLNLSSVRAPAQYRLVVGIGEAASVSQPRHSASPVFENDWDIWVYPPEVKNQPADGVVIAKDLDDRTLNVLEHGGKVLLLIPPQRANGAQRGKVALGFSSIFWNTAWTGHQPPHTLGILCDPKNPAFAEFPTEYHSNWQWWYLIHRAGALVLDDLPADLHPTVQIIDDWVTNRRLALEFEAKMGKGKLIVSSIDLNSDANPDPVSRQMLHSLLDYMAGPKFKPAVELTPSQIRGLIVAQATK